jgi:hypothetical protein
VVRRQCPDPHCPFNRFQWYVQGRGSKLPFGAGFCHTGPEKLGTTAATGAWYRYVDLNYFRSGVYRAKVVPGPGVNGAAKESPEVAVNGNFLNLFIAPWGCREVMQGFVS